MASPVTRVINPSLPRLFGTLVVSDLAVVVGLFFAIGPGRVFQVLVALVLVATVCLYLLAAVRGRPRVELTDEGFTVRTPLGSRSYRWADVAGDFVVQRVGPLSKFVAFRVTPECKANRKLGRPPCPGYDAAIAGRYQLSMEQLAELLSAERRRALTPPAQSSANHSGDPRSSP